MVDIDVFAHRAEELGSTVLKNESMSLHTTFKIGGETLLFVKPNSIEGFKQLVISAKELDISINIIGNGSNLLVSDGKLDSVFFTLCDVCDKIELIDDVTVRCGAGVSLSRLCTFACEHSLSGLEFAYGIPGTVGGAVFMNAGAFDGEIGNLVLSCKHINPNGTECCLAGSEIGFSYRNSAYKTNGCYITEVTLKLENGKKQEIEDRMKEFLSRRKMKQPLEYPSAGSFFKRPAGNYAGALIEKCGLKGKTIGGAQISKKHAGFIINVNNATCSDVIELMEYTQKTVFENTGVMLEPEVLFIK